MFPTIRILPCALLLAAFASSAAGAATLEVHVTGVTAATGRVAVAVCDRERFLKQCSYAVSAPARAGETVLQVAGVPPGTWAVLAYHDENGNGQLDRTLVGIPSEDYGFSRDARGRFGPPAFEQAAIEVRERRERRGAQAALRPAREAGCVSAARARSATWRAP